MSIRLALALASFILDLWAIERVWRPTSPYRGRLRWTAAIVMLPLLGAVLAVRRHSPVVAEEQRPDAAETQ